MGQRCETRRAVSWPYAVDLGSERLPLEQTHHAAQLVTELAAGLNDEATIVTVERERITENPSSFLKRRIEEHYWSALTRRIEPDPNSLGRALDDSKIGVTSDASGGRWCQGRIPRCDRQKAAVRSSSTATSEHTTNASSSAQAAQQFVYVPESDPRGVKAFTEAKLPQSIVVRPLPTNAGADWVSKTTAAKDHGLLVLALDEQLRGRPYVVPGGRFNEMYGWDSFFIVWGLMQGSTQDSRNLELARAMVDNHVYEIRHYGKILNANRSYYLTRSQPPLLTSMLSLVWDGSPRTESSKAWLERSLAAAIDEYLSVWSSSPRLTQLCDAVTCLSRYYGEGRGQPPEVEPEHFAWLYQRAALRNQRCAPPGDDPGSQRLFIHCARQLGEDYRAGRYSDPQIDDFFTHDRCVRESGHDTTYRWFDGKERCADFATVDLNSLLFKYEIDIARLLAEHFDGGLREHTATQFCERARARARLVEKYLYNEGAALFFDYDTKNARQSSYLSATTLYPLWASAPNPCDAALVDPTRASQLSAAALRELESLGGLMATAPRSQQLHEPAFVLSEATDGSIAERSVGRQWEAPNGWAPHQMLAWQGLKQWGQPAEAQRLAYRWLYMIVSSAANYHGTVPEKFDVVRRTHQVFEEYGNVNTEFAYIADEGFGWMNASYLVGQQLLSDEQLAALQRRVAPEHLETFR